MSLPVAILAALLSGAVIGGILVLVILRIRTGGKSGAAVRKELDEYRSEVGEHFDKTAEMLATMTEQYRSLFEHLSADARNLTGRDAMAHALEASRGIISGQQAGGRLEDNRSPDAKQGPDDRSGPEAGESGDPGLEAMVTTDESGDKSDTALASDIPAPPQDEPIEAESGNAGQPAVDDDLEEGPAITDR